MLTDTKLRNLKPGEKTYKVADRDGLYVAVLPSGTVSFRYNYRINGRQETLVLGRYGPEGLSLAEAREMLIAAKKSLACGDSPAQQQSNDFLQQFEGRTGITKLNSTQVFTGMPPVKITVTALFRAWRDTLSEVETPFNKLMEWALPVALSPDGSVLARTAETVSGRMGYVEALTPSKSPTRIAMEYKGRTYSPLVIESIGMPLSAPVDASGRFVELAVPLTLCTLTAIDRQDWSNSRLMQM